MRSRAFLLAVALAAPTALFAQAPALPTEPPRFGDRFGQPAETQPPGPPPDAPLREPPRFDDRFGPSNGSGELTPAQPPASREAVPPSTQSVGVSDILRDVAALPAPVRLTRERIAAAARSGDLAALARIVTSSPVRVQLGPDPVDDPAAWWRSQNPDSDGREVLALVLGLLDQPYVHLDAGTPNEMYVWPAYAHLPLDQLTPAQEVELYRLITGAYLQEMRSSAAWTFFRLGISPDGTLHYFAASE